MTKVNDEKTVVTTEATEVEKKSKPKKDKGIVANCEKLNIRTKPNIKADKVCVVDVKTKLTIDQDKSTNSWFSVTTEDGNEGFCMKKYVLLSK